MGPFFHDLKIAQVARDASKAPESAVCRSKCSACEAMAAADDAGFAAFGNTEPEPTATEQQTTSVAIFLDEEEVLGFHIWVSVLSLPEPLLANQPGSDLLSGCQGRRTGATAGQCQGHSECGPCPGCGDPAEAACQHSQNGSGSLEGVWQALRGGHGRHTAARHTSAGKQASHANDIFQVSRLQLHASLGKIVGRMDARMHAGRRATSLHCLESMAASGCRASLA